MATNYVTLTNGNSSLSAGDGDYDVTGTAATDGTSISLGNGNKVITTGSGVDTIAVGTGKLSVKTADGNDSVTSLVATSLTADLGAGDDYIFNTGSGILSTNLDRLAGKVYLGEGNNTAYLYDSIGDVTVTAGTGDDNLYIATQNGVTNIDVGAGNNSVATEYAGAYYSTGGSAVGVSTNDTVRVSGGANSVSTGAGTDIIRLTNSAQSTVIGTTGNKDVSAEVTAGNVSISYGDGKHTILTGNGDDSISLGSGTAYIRTLEGNSTVSVGVGDVTFISGSGNDSLTSYTKSVLYANVGAGDDYIFNTGAGVVSGVTERLSGKVYLGEGANTAYIYDSNGDLTVTAGSGNDSLYIATNNGLTNIDVGKGNNSVYTEYAGAYYSTGGDATGLFSNDVIRVGGGNNIISTGNGTDVIRLQDSATAVVLGANGDKDVKGDATSGDTSVSYGDGKHTVFSGNGNDTISLGKGDSYIRTAEGDSTITVGTGNVVIVAGDGTGKGSGNDSVTVNATSSLYANLADGDDYIFNTGSGVIAGVGDRLSGTVYLGQGNNTAYIYDSIGDLTLTGGSGNDAVYIATHDGATVINLGAGDNSLTTEYAGAYYSNGGSSVGLFSNDTVRVGGGANSISTGNGTDVIRVGTSTSATVIGADGNKDVAADTTAGDMSVSYGNGYHKIATGNGNDSISLGEGNAYIRTLNGSSSVMVGLGNVDLVAGSDIDNVTSRAAQSLTAVLGAGDDTIFNIGTGAAAATDYLVAQIDLGTGNNTAYIYDSVGKITLNAGNGDNSIYLGTSGESIITLGNGTNLVTTEYLGAFYGGIPTDPSSKDNVTTGTGNDSINTGTGADTIRAGWGDDTIVVSGSDDLVIFDAGATSVTNNDIVYGVTAGVSVKINGSATLQLIDGVVTVYGDANNTMLLVGLTSLADVNLV